MLELNKIYQGDCLELMRTFPDEIVDCVISSPPYWGLRDYGVKGQIGLEKIPELFVAKMVEIFREVKRILKKDGTLWLNLGDSYASEKVENTNGLNGTVKQKNGVNENSIKRKIPPLLKPKDICGIPWRVAFALQADGWYLRQDIIWHKPNPMPESVKDRCTKAHEYIFLLTKSNKYYYDYQAILEKAAYDGRADTQFKGGTKYKDENFMPEGNNNQNFQIRGHDRWSRRLTHTEESSFTRRKLKDTNYSGDGAGFHKHSGNYDAEGNLISNVDTDGIPARNKRSVWSVSTQPFKAAHFATFPEELIKPMVLAGTSQKGVVFDPFMGAGTVALTALRYNRSYIGIELNPEYVKIADKRIKDLKNQEQLNFING